MTIDLPTVGFAMRVGSQRLSAGEAFVDVAGLTTRHGAETLVTHVTLVGFDAPQEPLRFGDSMLAVVDGSALAWPALNAPLFSTRLLAGRGEGYQLEEFEETWFPSAERVDWTSELQEFESVLFARDDRDGWDDQSACQAF